MKLRYKLMLFSPTLALGGLLFFTNAGRPILEQIDSKLPGDFKLSSLSNSVRENAESGLKQLKIHSEKHVYSWRDANGKMHFSEEPPPAGTANVTLQKLPQPVNVIPSVAVDEEAIDQPTAEKKGPDLGIPFPSTIPLDDIPKLIEDAKDLQKLADKRNQVLQDI